MGPFKELKIDSRIFFLALTSGAAVLGLLGSVFFLDLMGFGAKENLNEEIENIAKERPAIEIFSLVATILRVDTKNNLIIVKHPVNEQEIKARLSEDSEILKLEFPSGSENPSGSAAFVPRVKKILFANLKPRDQVVVESQENIYNKTEFNKITRVQVLP